MISCYLSVQSLVSRLALESMIALMLPTKWFLSTCQYFSQFACEISQKSLSVSPIENIIFNF